MKNSGKFLCIFLVSLFTPAINDNLWTLSGINFWINYAVLFVIAFLGLCLIFGLFDKN
jgi:hypothetical protein